MPEATDRRIDYVMVRCGPHGPTLRVTTCERVLVDPADGARSATTTAWSPSPRPPTTHRAGGVESSQ
ncbi:hypothetical protein JBE27_03155 [Streptomyces albiflaviniger]|nr:hypothetical protein [Streptomyces albiflaviniger]